MNAYNRRDVLRILGISARQLQGWERAGLIPRRASYSFRDLGQLRTLCALRAEAVPVASIRESILAMKAVAGMANPLLEARVVRSGTRIAFRHRGATMDPIRRQLLFDFERAGFDQPGAAEPGAAEAAGSAAQPLQLRPPASHEASASIEARFQTAVRFEETGDKERAIAIYEEILCLDPRFAPAAINLGTLYFHLRRFERAEECYRRASETDPDYVLAYFDLGNVLDELGRLEESIAAYRRAVALSPRYADAHYNLALALERKGAPRAALRHWQVYLGLDCHGPWAEHARNQIRGLIQRETLTIAARADRFVPRRRGTAALALV